VYQPACRYIEGRRVVPNRYIEVVPSGTLMPVVMDNAEGIVSHIGIIGCPLHLTGQRVQSDVRTRPVIVVPGGERHKSRSVVDQQRVESPGTDLLVAGLHRLVRQREQRILR